jgi:hypothetical protein
MSSTLYEARLHCCDRCPAPARFEILLSTGQNLLFCGPCGYAINREAGLTERYAVLPIPTAEELEVFSESRM